MTTRDKMAQAIYDVACVDDLGIVDNVNEVVDAILDAMKTPTEKMMAAGIKQWCKNGDTCNEETDVKTIFTAMIDAIKAEK